MSITSGSLNWGNFPLFQSKLPLSTTIPPIVFPWPFKAFVAECTTISAPNLIGLNKYGVANVLSTIRGILCSWASSASASIPLMTALGLLIDSTKIAFVSSLIFFLN